MGENHTSLVRGHLSAVNRKSPQEKPHKNRFFFLCLFCLCIYLCICGGAPGVFISFHHTDLTVEGELQLPCPGRWWHLQVLASHPARYHCLIWVAMCVSDSWLLPGLPVQCLSGFVCSHGDRHPGFPNSSPHTAYCTYSLNSATLGGFRSAFGMFG